MADELSDFADEIGIILDSSGAVENFGFGFDPAPFFDGFTDSRERFYTVTGVEAGRVNLMPKPRPAGQAVLVNEHALGGEDGAVDIDQGCGGKGLS